MPLTESVNQESATVSPQRDSISAERPNSLRTAKQETTTQEDKVCWIEVKRYPYQPDHQVELLHLQAEADALLIKLQSCSH